MPADIRETLKERYIKLGESTKDTDSDRVIAYKEMAAKFTDNDIAVLQLYYMWATRIVAEEDGVISLINQGSRGINGINDWTFAGMIDLGTNGAAKCSAGHNLRYAYYLHSPSTGEELVYGADCLIRELGIQVDSSKLMQLLYATDMELYDALCRSRSMGDEETFVRDRTYLILRTLQRDVGFRDRFVKTLGRTTTEVYLNFMACRFVLPTKLRERVIEAFVKTVNDMAWGGEPLSIFESQEYPYIKCLDIGFKETEIVAQYDSKLVAVNDITFEMPNRFLPYIPFRQLLSCAVLNAYLNFDVVLEDFLTTNGLNILSIMNDLGKIMELAKRLTPYDNSRAQRVYAYTEGTLDYETPVDVFIGALRSNSISECYSFTSMSKRPGINGIADIFFFFVMHKSSITKKLIAEVGDLSA